MSAAGAHSRALGERPSRTHLATGGRRAQCLLKRWAFERLRVVGPKALRLGRYTKRAILVAGDLVVLSFALWLAFALRLGELFVPASRDVWLVLAAAPLI